jgi:hypothetical protein
MGKSKRFSDKVTRFMCFWYSINKLTDCPCFYEWSMQLVKWDQLSLAAAMGPAAEELLASGLDGYVNQARRVEELFGKIWPPPNV